MERKIGEEFDYNGIMLKVIIDDMVNPCEGCHFQDNCYDRERAKAGGCISEDREDNKNVKFIKVGDMVKETKTIKIPEGWEVDKVENGKVILKKGNPVLPGTFEECLSSVGSDPYYSIHLPRGKSKAINSLCKLIICREAWWKQLNYKPNWFDHNEKKYCIHVIDGYVTWSTHSQFPRILAFPTQEVCNEFKEAFKNLIEEAKELL